MSGSLLWGPSGCKAGLLFPGWHGPREHEGLWFVHPGLYLKTVNYQKKCSAWRKISNIDIEIWFVYLNKKKLYWLTEKRTKNWISPFRNCGPARTGCVWAGVQSVEKQGVRLSQLQPKHRSVTICPAPGEMPGNGAEQQPHSQPQVGEKNGRHLNHRIVSSLADVPLAFYINNSNKKKEIV